MADPNATQDPAVNAATPDVSVSSPATEGGKEEANNLPQPQAEGGQPQDLGSGDEDLSVEELKKKYSESSKEARLLKEEKEREAEKARQESLKVRQLQEDFLSVITESKETFERYLDKQGLSPADKEQYLAMYDTQIAKGQQPTAPSPQATGVATQPLPPVNPLRESWMRDMDREWNTKVEARSKASQEFLADPANKDLDEMTLSVIWTQAEYYDVKHGMKPDEALKAARRAVLETESIKDEGYIEGVRDTYVGGISKGVSGSSGAKGSAFTLSKKDEAFVNAEIQNRGLTGQEAESFRKDYALRVQRSKE